MAPPGTTQCKCGWHQGLPPGVEYREESDLRAQMLGVSRDGAQRLGGSPEQNSARSRNVRLAALHSFFRFVALHAPDYNAVAQRVLAMQSKRYVPRPICFLTPVETEALLSAGPQHLERKT
jgi:integrase/recombinase XerD